MTCSGEVDHGQMLSEIGRCGLMWVHIKAKRSKINWLSEIDASSTLNFQNITLKKRQNYVYLVTDRPTHPDRLFGLIDQQANVIRSIEYVNQQYELWYNSFLTKALGTTYARGAVADFKPRAKAFFIFWQGKLLSAIEKLHIRRLTGNPIVSHTKNLADRKKPVNDV